MSFSLCRKKENFSCTHGLGLCFPFSIFWTETTPSCSVMYLTAEPFPPCLLTYFCCILAPAIRNHFPLVTLACCKAVSLSVPPSFTDLPGRKYSVFPQLFCLCDCLYHPCVFLQECNRLPSLISPPLSTYNKSFIVLFFLWAILFSLPTHPFFPLLSYLLS